MLVPLPPRSQLRIVAGHPDCIALPDDLQRSSMAALATTNPKGSPKPSAQPLTVAEAAQVRPSWLVVARLMHLRWFSHTVANCRRKSQCIR